MLLVIVPYVFITESLAVFLIPCILCISLSYGYRINIIGFILGNQNIIELLGLRVSMK